MSNFHKLCLAYSKILALFLLHDLVGLIEKKNSQICELVEVEVEKMVKCFQILKIILFPTYLVVNLNH